MTAAEKRPEPSGGAFRENRNPRELSQFANGHSERPSAGLPQNGGERRTLHLSLGERSDGNGIGTAPVNGNGANNANGGRAVNGKLDSMSPHHVPPPAQPSLPRQPQGYGAPSPSRWAGPQQQRSSESSSLLDQALRERVESDIDAFLAAFDSALAQDTIESRATLREATDRLLRAGARTRIELERLEARMPLPPRDKSAQDRQLWRDR